MALWGFAIPCVSKTSAKQRLSVVVPCPAAAAAVGDRGADHKLLFGRRRDLASTGPVGVRGAALRIIEGNRHENCIAMGNAGFTIYICLGCRFILAYVIGQILVSGQLLRSGPLNQGLGSRPRSTHGGDHGCFCEAGLLLSYWRLVLSAGLWSISPRSLD